MSTAIVTTQEVVNHLQKLTEKRITRLALSFLFKKDEKKRTYLELLLAKYRGEKIHVPLLVKAVYPLFRAYMDKVIATFEVDKQELLEYLEPPYAKKGIATILKGFKEFGVRVPFTSGAPLLVVWDFTYRCNLKCKHCYASAGKFLPEMNVEERLRALDILVDAGVPMLALSGGEPLLGPGFWGVLERANDYGLYLAMATNGTLITEETAEKLAKFGVRFAQVSLDAPDPKFHDEFRGVLGAWEKAVRGIRNLKKYGITVEVSMVITKKNYTDLQRMLHFLKNELRVDMFMAYNFVPVGRAKYITEWDLPPELRWDVLKKLALELYNGFSVASTAPQYAVVAYNVGEELGVNPMIAGHFYTMNLLSEKFGSMLEFLGGCGAGRVYLALEPNGDIYPCVFFRKKIGNILQDDFEELWKNNELLEALRNRDLLKDTCGECPYKYICGGCRARAYNYFGDPLAPDPGCIYNKKYWEEILNTLTANPTKASQDEYIPNQTKHASLPQN